jgi:hypothetical protein
MSVQSTSDGEQALVQLDPLSPGYTEQQAADIIRKSKRTIRRYRAEGKLGYRVIGSTIYITPRHLQDLYAAGEVGFRRRKRR